MTQGLFEFLKKQDVEYIRSFNFSKVSSIAIGGTVSLVAIPSDISSFIRTLDYLSKNKIKYKVIGRATNTLMLGDFYDGVIIFTNKLTNYFAAENTIYAECGTSLSKLLREVSALGYGGAEELYGIPGSIGGAVFGNAGAFGKSISDSFVEGRFYSPIDKRTLIITADEMNFSYRHSIMKEREIILLSAKFKFTNKAPDTIKAKMRDIILKRVNSQPYHEKSLGSIFKRCSDIPTSRLIEELGFKGFSVGGASVSMKHAGFIINSGGATSSDVVELVNIIKDKIQTVYHLSVQEEIQYF
ncbi:MAG: UDP-N-acetylmuramate dehydrogenase [Ruminococcaceae bacterium]|nr:UDP-N-acetylmuramate dehydrogenase [Oscillospiraceae bacterium]